MANVFLIAYNTTWHKVVFDPVTKEHSIAIEYLDMPGNIQAMIPSPSGYWWAGSGYDITTWTWNGIDTPTNISTAVGERYYRPTVWGSDSELAVGSDNVEWAYFYLVSSGNLSLQAINKTRPYGFKSGVALGNKKFHIGRYVYEYVPAAPPNDPQFNIIASTYEWMNHGVLLPANRWAMDRQEGYLHVFSNPDDLSEDQYLNLEPLAGATGGIAKSQCGKWLFIFLGAVHLLSIDQSTGLLTQEAWTSTITTAGSTYRQNHITMHADNNFVSTISGGNLRAISFE
jgi:hypothetical protein